jgi:hypothetical protein
MLAGFTGDPPVDVLPMRQVDVTMTLECGSDGSAYAELIEQIDTWFHGYAAVLRAIFRHRSKTVAPHKLAFSSISSTGFGPCSPGPLKYVEPER